MEGWIVLTWLIFFSALFGVFFTVWCTLVQSAVLRLHVVCLSVTLVDQDHIGWKPWKLIAWTISPTPSLFVAQRPSIYALLRVATWWFRALGFDVMDRAALLFAVPQLGTLYQRPFAISLHHPHHHASVAISKLNFFAGHMALTHRSTFVIVRYK